MAKRSTKKQQVRIEKIKSLTNMMEEVKNHINPAWNINVEDFFASSIDNLAVFTEDGENIYDFLNSFENFGTDESIVIDWALQNDCMLPGAKYYTTKEKAFEVMSELVSVVFMVFVYDRPNLTDLINGMIEGIDNMEDAEQFCINKDKILAKYPPFAIQEEDIWERAHEDKMYAKALVNGTIR